jgi:hypothetical protein
MKFYKITEEALNTIIEWSHSYGRSEQFNYGMFGPNAKQAVHFTKEKALEYIMDNLSLEEL